MWTCALFVCSFGGCFVVYVFLLLCLCVCVGGGRGGGDHVFYNKGMPL